jgi:hypothetical protein
LPGGSAAAPEFGHSQTLQSPERVGRDVGIRAFDGEWADFYRAASAAPEPVLVKTHQAPRDGQPAIYVVRDGRKSLLSYQHYHARYTPAPRPTLSDLVLGLDHYGGWSEHYRGWAARSAPTLLLRYEQLVAPNPQLLQELGAFIGCTPVTTQWVNPFKALQERLPDFYREGQVAWSGDPAWTPWVDVAFMRLHGELMAELGYATAEQVQQSRAAVPEGLDALLAVVQGLLTERKALRRVCEERQVVIDGLKHACDERLALIERLSGGR